MHKGLVDLNTDMLNKTLKKCLPEQLQQHSVSAVLLALGSNHHAEYYLPHVRKQLAELGKVSLSTAFQNPDFTATLAQPKPDYTNQCVYLSLTSTMTLQQLQQTFKKFEGDCKRQHLTEPSGIRQVTMDIDILLVKLSTDNNSLSDNNTLLDNSTLNNECVTEWVAQWIIMADRYPFKEHERVGVEELVANSFVIN